MTTKLKIKKNKSTKKNDKINFIDLSKNHENIQEIIIGELGDNKISKEKKCKNVNSYINNDDKKVKVVTKTKSLKSIKHYDDDSEEESIKVNEKVKKTKSFKDKKCVENINNNKIKIVLLNNDCLNELKNMEDETIDCVITDPPYFIDKLDNKWSSKEIKEDTKNSHIKHLPKGMKFDKNQVIKLYEFYFELSNILIKKMKPGAYFLSFSSPRLYHSIAMACELAGFEVRDMINWVYTQTMPKGMSVNHIIDKMDKTKEEKEKIKKEYENFKTPMIRSCFEPICVAMKPTKGTFIQNELNFKTGLINFNNKVGIGCDKVPANIITTEEINDTYDKNFLVSKPNKEEKKDYNTHITVKPLGIMEHLIKIFTKENSLVFDPFMGSGTTGISCKKNNRNFIGIELNKEYFDIAKKRINETN